LRSRLTSRGNVRKEFYLDTGVSDNGSIVNGYGNTNVYLAKPISKNSINKWRGNAETIEKFNAYEPAVTLLKTLGYSS
jgi:hypothetical protein